MALNREKIHQAVQRLVLKGQLDKAIQELRPILDEDPADTRTLQKVAELYRKKGAYQEAEGVYARLAEVFMRGGFFQRAVAVHNQILQLNPTNLPVHIALGDTLTKLGLLQEANKIYARTVGLLQRAGRFDEATAILEKLIGTAPDNYQARLQLAELYLKAGRNDAAIKAFEEALPTLRAQGRDDLFQRAAERLLYYQPENLPLCRELSVFHLRRGNVPQAMKLLQYCHKRDPQDVDTLRLLASHFETAGDPDKAIVVLHQMARVFEDRGDKAAAAETYSRILEAHPQDPEAAKALGAGVPLPAPSTAPSPPPSPPPRRPLPPPPPPRGAARLPAAARPGIAEAERQAEITSEHVSADEIQEIPSAVLRAEEAQQRAADLPSVEPPPAAETAVPQAPAERPAPVRVLSRSGGPDLPPLPDEPSEIQKIAAEADIFVKFGLKDRSIGHLSGGLGQFPQSIVLRDRLIAIHLNDENLSSAVRVMLDAARVLSAGHPDHARRYAREALFLDEDNAAAREVLVALEGEGPMPAAEPAPAELAPAELVEEEVEPAARRPSSVPDVGSDLDVDIDVASEPVRTIIISPHAVAPPPAPIPAAPAVPARAMVLDLPSFDDVETGPPLLSLAPPPPSGERLVVPVSEAAAAPLVLEMDEEDFDAELPAGLPADLPEAEAEPSVAVGSADGAVEALDSGGPIEAGEVSASGLQTQSLPTSEKLPQAPELTIGPSPVYPPVPAAVAHVTPSSPPSAAAPSFAAVTQGLEEVDFFFQQGLVDDARTLLEGLSAEHPDNPRIAAKLEELGGGGAPAAVATSGDALEALDSAFDALEAGGSGMRPMPGANDDEAVVTVSPADAVMHFDLGVAYREMGVLDRAIDEFKLAALDLVREANCHVLIGACLVGLGKPKEAVDALKKGLHAKKKTAQDEQELYYGLAEAHLAAGDNKEALFYLQTIKRKDPDFRDVATKINALLSSTRPGKRPAHKPDAPASTEPEPNIDQAFDDMFKEDHH